MRIQAPVAEPSLSQGWACVKLGGFHAAGKGEFFFAHNRGGREAPSNFFLALGRARKQMIHEHVRLTLCLLLVYNRFWNIFKF